MVQLLFALLVAEASQEDICREIYTIRGKLECWKKQEKVVCSPERMVVTHAHADTVAGTFE